MNLNQKTVRLSRLALFSALILLLNYTPLGYIRVFALEITQRKYEIVLTHTENGWRFSKFALTI